VTQLTGVSKNTIVKLMVEARIHKTLRTSPAVAVGVTDPTATSAMLNLPLKGRSRGAVERVRRARMEFPLAPALDT
jgi:hypothetical protein